MKDDISRLRFVFVHVYIYCIGEVALFLKENLRNGVFTFMVG